MKNIETIWVLVATTDHGILQNHRLLNLETNPNFQLVISNQQIHNKTPLKLDKPYTTVLNSTAQGLSANRNNLLDAVKSGIGILADDDVSYREDLEPFIRTHFQDNPAFDILSFQIHDYDGTPYKTYPKKAIKLLSNSLINRYRLLRISSVELAFRICSIKNNSLSFHTDFGIGSKKYIAGEEGIFLLDALKKGLALKYCPEPMTYHPGEGTGKKWEASQLIALGRLYKKAFGGLSIFLSVYIAIKKHRTLQANGIGFFKRLRLLIFGQ